MPWKHAATILMITKKALITSIVREILILYPLLSHNITNEKKRKKKEILTKKQNHSSSTPSERLLFDLISNDKDYK